MAQVLGHARKAQGATGEESERRTATMTNPNTKPHTLSVQISHEMRRQLQEAAAHEGVTVSQLTRDALPGKEETTVALDYGRTKLGDVTIQLFGTPGQPRFDFMWEILASEMHGFVVMVDSSDATTFPTAKKLIEMFRGFENVPYIIAANKQDLDGASSPQEIRSALD